MLFIKYTSKYTSWPIVQESYTYLICYVFLALDYIVVSVIMFGMNSYLTRIEKLKYLSSLVYCTA